MNEAIYKKRLQGRLSCELEGRVWPVCFNQRGYLEVIRRHVEPERFQIGMLAHPLIGGGIAFEFRSAAGRQLVVGKHDGLTEAAEPRPVPGPALRIHSYGNLGADFPNQYYVKLQSLDSRWVAVSGRRKKSRDWEWFSMSPPRQVPITIAERESGILRLLEPDFAKASTFTLELLTQYSVEA
ncbi:MULTISPECIES: hypothetical protein [unclassified Pseudomonas]|uniref:hypothetical protein n=1 Tax=unclassified Pseudomonas TaxID=196821 RepID=UPI002448BC1C|nr:MULTISPECIES: hypothetical protein [unclassified Pseudomonas]MDH0302744.1 hypothetical protein [Pseudomonas sp. GD04091]MDH1984443.1 hypothetical protein [Pseudomonas sp. GD03689]